MSWATGAHGSVGFGSAWRAACLGFPVNYKHLHYFWAVAHAGGIVKAGEQLHVTSQTLSTQIKLLEERLGKRLLRKAGHGVELTAAGKVALQYADEIFSARAELEQAQRDEGGARDARPLALFRVGIADSVPKSIADHVIESAMHLRPPMRVLCSEGKLSGLLGELAVHQLDLVIADVPLPAQISVKACSHVLGKSSISFFAAPELLKTLAGPAQRRFPAVLERLPVLLPGAESAAATGGLAASAGPAATRGRRIRRPRAGAGLRPGRRRRVRRTHGAGSRGAQHYGVTLLGRAEDLAEEFYASPSSGASPTRRSRPSPTPRGASCSPERPCQ